MGRKRAASGGDKNPKDMKRGPDRLRAFMQKTNLEIEETLDWIQSDEVGNTSRIKFHRRNLPLDVKSGKLQLDANVGYASNETGIRYLLNDKMEKEYRGRPITVGAYVSLPTKCIEDLVAAYNQLKGMALNYKDDGMSMVWGAYCTLNSRVKHAKGIVESIFSVKARYQWHYEGYGVEDSELIRILDNVVQSRDDEDEEDEWWTTMEGCRYQIVDGGRKVTERRMTGALQPSKTYVSKAMPFTVRDVLSESDIAKAEEGLKMFYEVATRNDMTVTTQ